MSNFKILPFIQGKPVIPRRSWFHFLWLIIFLETIVGGYWIFRLNLQIAKLEQQINTIQTNENKEQVNVQ
jgi:hypothetical protein